MTDERASDPIHAAHSEVELWRHRLAELAEDPEFDTLPSSARNQLTALLADHGADPEAFVLRAQSLLGQNPELRALYRRRHAAPTGARGEIIAPTADRRRPSRRWTCPVPACGYETWGDRFHPAQQDHCPNPWHSRTQLMLAD
ncbi:hypothetical protein [Micromonospora sp. MH99]|uniref:hypothetical protein n=1 Tax=Micromonospora sp. MH99 TaxID=1945510 RepID=UPI001F3E1A0E|nr:hypothetical protein [Micromonospora sp. MH99]MCF0091931.1 hypothetical protein [Micromonospora sp. MH99]